MAAVLVLGLIILIVIYDRRERMQDERERRSEERRSRAAIRRELQRYD